ncbi:hypothetical protein [Myxosarcina sp. GI1]|uniref:hypothetical protein n=1 Tax=Myxosarcina sp. GI1 TaxID=1541065 RepID=UPI001C0FCD71|nr:hypothetical protein [Myxosarcina sp. GI1]
MIEALKSNPSGQIIGFHHHLAKQAIEKGIASDPHTASNTRIINQPYDLPQKYKIWTEDIIWDLVIEGLVRPGLGDGINNGLPWFHLSEHGKNVLQNQSPQPYDPDGYLATVRNIPHVDSIIFTYIEESLKAFRIHCLLSSAITLGCASEKAILILIDACKNAIQNPTDKANFAKQTNTISIKKKHDEFKSILNTKIIPVLPKDIKENLDNYLNGIFSIIRTQRNDAGHPSGNIVKREHLYSYLVTFPEYLKKVYSLIDWLNANKI